MRLKHLNFTIVVDCRKVSKKLEIELLRILFHFIILKKILNKECNKMNYGCIPQESVLFKKSLYIKSGGLNLKKLSQTFYYGLNFQNT